MLTADHAMETLRANSMRLTPQRLALIDVLVGNTSHPSADEVARQLSVKMPGISLTTVYKTLHEFADIGLIRELDLPGSMRFDPDVSRHAHLVCSACGSVLDIPLSRDGETPFKVPAGVRVHEVEITLKGTCSACSAS